MEYVVGEVLKPDARLGANNPDTAHQRPARVLVLRAEDMLDADAVKAILCHEKTSLTC